MILYSDGDSNTIHGFKLEMDGSSPYVLGMCADDVIRQSGCRVKVSKLLEEERN